MNYPHFLPGCSLAALLIVGCYTHTDVCLCIHTYTHTHSLLVLEAQLGTPTPVPSIGSATIAASANSLCFQGSHHGWATRVVIIPNAALSFVANSCCCLCCQILKFYCSTELLKSIFISTALFFYAA